MGHASQYSQLGLELPLSTSIQASINKFQEWSTFGTGKKFFCEFCKGCEKVMERCHPKSTPDTLLLAVPRTAESLRQQTVVDSSVWFRGECYRLDGSVNHQGSTLLYGHYTASISQGDGSGHWTVFDDSRVSRQTGQKRMSRSV